MADSLCACSVVCQKKINLNADRKRNWFSELKSLNDKNRCDSAAIPADIVTDLISKEEVDWYDELVNT